MLLKCIFHGFISFTISVETAYPAATSCHTTTSGNTSQLPAFVHAIQPILLYSALLQPTSDVDELTNHIYTIGFMHSIAFSDLVYEVLRSLLLSIPQETGLETLKVDSFILIKLPMLLEKLYLKIKAGIDYPSGLEPASSENDRLVLKTPTDVYKAFDKILKNDSLLDGVDQRCSCNIVEILLKVVAKSPTPLLTDTERDDVMKRRLQARKSGEIRLTC